MKEAKTTENIDKKPPVLVVLGHVDHGKTSLLDYIHNTKVASKESGGITQHIGAYQADHKGNKITFIDTPGHEAFSAMRSRGAAVADIALLVIASDDGVMPQTKEALKYIKESETPFIVVFNKIDVQGADVTKIKTQLLEEEVAVEGFGGDVPYAEVSAATGQGIDDLLELIMLVAEVSEISKNATGELSLVVVESYLDNKRGAGATLIVRDGVLSSGITLFGDSAIARIRAIEDFQGSRLSHADPGTPVIIFGFDDVPKVGDILRETKDVKQAQKTVETARQEFISSVEQENEIKENTINLYIKADTYGTLEACLEVLEELQKEDVFIQIVHSDVGEITDSDIRRALDTKSIIIGFRVKVSNIAKQFAQNNKVTCSSFDTIYELAEGVRKIAEQRALPPEEEIIGELKVLQVFHSSPSRMIVGGRVASGTVRSNSSVVVKREGEEKGKGKVSSLKNDQKDISSAEEGREVGIQFNGGVKIEPQDVIEFFGIKQDE